MSYESNSPPSANSSRRRRSSFTELFQKQGGTAVLPTPNTQPRPIYTGANAQASQRRMSLNTLGLSGSPNQATPFTGGSMRRSSVSSSVMSTSPTVDQAVVEETEEESAATTPPSPFARRVSFGAQALRGNSNGTSHSLGESWTQRNRSSSLFASSFPSDDPAPTASTSQEFLKNVKSNPSSYRPLGEGFNWPESLRIRAERAPSIGGFPPTSPNMHHQRSASVATMEAPPPERVEQQRQGQPRARPKPDYFQEKILRADFMD
ncbi:hypothetical protein LOZ51_000017 [Ophidiomyces ophidiicola]|nr:hypothetical protein LOZ55_004482 [Ophidiomyces ophidiicola]KAI1986859.1 hypothetical protein LOZ54_003748 [Ophidiomyces ophidiicola]KAI2002945.1 hypothetical protein LOZ51_000017 [Ophidiomyces ophidiicola]